jgi:hypothetical protein
MACVRKIGLVVVLAAACGTAPRPRHTQEMAERLAQVHVAVIEAEREHGAQDPRALSLRSSARRAYHDATRALEEGRVAAAQRALETAEADAELSLALARRERWERETKQLNAASSRLEAKAGKGGTQ